MGSINDHIAINRVGFEMKTDRDFLEAMDLLERAATNLKNEFKRYDFNDYLETERDIKQVKAKAKVLHEMLERMIFNKISAMQLAHDALNFRRKFIKEIGENPHVKQQWEEIMTTLAIIN